MKNFALYGYDEKLVKTVCGFLDFKKVENDGPLLNKGYTNLVKLYTAENLTERVLKSQKRRDESKKGVHV